MGPFSMGKAHPSSTSKPNRQSNHQSNTYTHRWFEQTKDLVPNHILAVPHPNACVGKTYVRRLGAA